MFSSGGISIIPFDKATIKGCWQKKEVLRA